MISENDELQRERDRANLAWAILCSLPLSGLFWWLLVWLLAHNPSGLQATILRMGQKPELLVSSSIVHMEKRPVPEPHQRVAEPQLPVVPAPQPKAVKQRTQPQAQPTEIAREVPNASPVPRAAKTRQTQASLAEVLAQQQVAFQHEADQLNASRAPLSNATIDPNNRPSSQRQYHMDFSGLPHVTNPGQGFIMPLRSWTDSGLDCYYGHYDYEYPSGATESGNIPWAFCYTPREDPFPRNVHWINFPPPMPGYRLPPGTELTPIEKEMYDYWLARQ